MKKEYFILIAVIVFASLYLFMHKENKDNYKLPEIKTIDTSTLTGIIIKNEKETIKFVKKNKNWVLTDNEYPVDSTALQDMLDVFQTFKLTALVSEKTDLQRYELDKKKQIRVKLLEKDKTIFEVTMGKPAPSYNHTFVMIANDKNIYHANGSFRADFNKPVDDFRDKQVLKFNKDSIKQFSIKKEGKFTTLIATKEKKQDKEPSVTWSVDNGTAANKEIISQLLSNISFLKCEKYLEDLKKNSLKNRKPLCEILLEGKNKIELTLFKNSDTDKITGISSMNNSAFILSKSNSDEIVSNIENLLKIKK